MLTVDVDVTLTNGKMYYGSEGEVLKTFDTRDPKRLARIWASGVRVTAWEGPPGTSLTPLGRCEWPELLLGQWGLTKACKQAVEAVKRHSIGGSDLDPDGPAVGGVIDHEEPIRRGLRSDALFSHRVRDI